MGCCSLDEEDILKFTLHTSNGLEMYNAIIFAPPVIPILFPFYTPYMKRLMVFFNEWRMLQRRAKKPFQTSVNHYSKSLLKSIMMLICERQAAAKMSKHEN